jgi:hypothetical protein
MAGYSGKTLPESDKKQWLEEIVISQPGANNFKENWNKVIQFIL